MSSAFRMIARRYFFSVRTRQVPASVLIDLAMLTPQYQQMLLQNVIEGGNIRANFKD